MDVRDYPVDVRADYPQHSSRLWAVLTIFWIKALALIPHGIILIFLGIAQFFVALIAQFVVTIKGEYPAGMHRFVTGVLRWQTRVSAFFFSITDRYPPFTLEPRPDYPIDVVTERPAQPSRVYALFTIIVEILAVVAGLWLVVWILRNVDTSTWVSSDNGGSGYRFNFNFPTGGTGSAGLILRQLAAIPHYFVLFFLGIAAFVIWFVVQWVILFVARFPFGMWEIEAGWVRWSTRVSAYALGLIDRYPPFSMSPSIAGGAGGQPLAPPPPMTGTWPQAPAAGMPQPPAPQPPAPQPPAPQPPAPQSPAPQVPAPPPPQTPGAQAPAPPAAPDPEPPRTPPSPDGTS